MKKWGYGFVDYRPQGSKILSVRLKFELPKAICLAMPNASLGLIKAPAAFFQDKFYFGQ